MDGADNVGVLVVNRLPLGMRLVEFEDMADVIVCEVHILVFHLAFAFGSGELARHIVLYTLYTAR